jgi:hypothetical protein
MMYRSLLDERMRKLYDRAEATVTLSAEIQLLRAYLSRAVESGDERAIMAIIDMLIKVVRVQAQNNGDESEFDHLIARVADEIRQEAADDKAP